MPNAVAELLALVLLAASLITATIRPFGLSEAVVAAPAAVLLVVTDVVPHSAATHTLREIGPTVGFLAAILVFAHLCAQADVFAYLGRVAAATSRGGRGRLLTVVVALAAVVTAVLTLDATVILLTPVVLATTTGLDVPPRVHLYACARLANTGSLLLPVSNLTNLLAFSASGLSFGRFAALMAVPWLIAVASERFALGRFFRTDLDGPLRPTPMPPMPAPVYALTVLALTVVGFVLTSSLHVAPAWAALAGCLALLGPHLRRHGTNPRGLVAAANPGFCVFVLALAVVVDGVTRHGLGRVLRDVVPAGTGLGSLLAIAGVAALLANVVNNLPATLALVGAVPVILGSPAAVLALLIGVNIGPNATYAGSLATLLWRRTLPDEVRPRAATFHRLGLITVPVLLVITTIVLWVAVTVIGT